MLSGIPDESIDCVWTDPPYLLSNGGITCVAGRMVSVDKGDWDKSWGIEADYQFNVDWTKECYRVLKSTVPIWVSGTLHIYPSIAMALLRNGFRLLNSHCRGEYRSRRLTWGVGHSLIGLKSCYAASKAPKMHGGINTRSTTMRCVARMTASR